MLPFLMRPMLRWGLFALCLIGSGAWVWWGAKLSLAGGQSEARVTADRMVAQLASHDPRAADELRKMRAEAPQGTDVLANLAAGRPDGLSLLKGLAERRERTGALPEEVRLAQTAIASDVFVDPAEREAFLVSHGTLVEVLLQADPDGKLLASYRTELEAAATDPQRLREAFDDPTALFVRKYVADRDLREFAREQRDWLQELLPYAVGPEVFPDGRPVPESFDLDPARGLTQVLHAAKAYHPLTKETVAGLGLGWLGFELFLENGDLIRGCHERRVPLDETLEVLFANRDWLRERQAKLSADGKVGAARLAEELAERRAKHPHVWLIARHSPGVLRFEEDCPDQADPILEKYGSDDVPALLYEYYPESVPTAAKAVVQYGDLAIYLLVKYRGDARFRDNLANPAIGARLIPYLAVRDDAGLDQLKSGVGDLDKSIDAQGNPKEPEWWTHLPGGGLGNVVRNWRNGYPNEWSELGWATLDVADAALLVASFGTSSVASAGLKGGAAQAARAGAKFALRREAAEQVILRAGKAAKGARQAAQAAVRQRASLLRRFVQGGGAVATASLGLRYAGRMLTGAAALTYRAAKTVHVAWRNVPPHLRTWVARGLMAATFLFRLHHQWAPNADKIADGLATFIGKTGEKLVDLLGPLIHKIVEEMLAGLTGLRTPWLGWVAYVGTLLAFLGGAWWLNPFRRRSLSYA